MRRTTTANVQHSVAAASSNIVLNEIPAQRIRAHKALKLNAKLWMGHPE
jgi:hypothetical protein